jgi:hypothetical protein
VRINRDSSQGRIPVVDNQEVSLGSVNCQVAGRSTAGVNLSQFLKFTFRTKLVANDLSVVVTVLSARVCITVVLEIQIVDLNLQEIKEERKRNLQTTSSRGWQRVNAGLSTSLGSPSLLRRHMDPSEGLKR